MSSCRSGRRVSDARPELEGGSGPASTHSFLIESERVAVVDWPGGRLHLRRADDPGKLGCGRLPGETRACAEPTIEWIVGWMIPSDLLCKRCLDAFERSTRVYAVSGMGASWERESEKDGRTGLDRGRANP